MDATPEVAYGQSAIVLRILEQESGWEVVNDGVMGGRSTSTLRIENGVAVFAGNLSSENNGGFASVRTAAPRLPANVQAIAIRVRGDGKRYQLRVRTHARLDGVAYRHHFETDDGRWQEIVLPLASFRPSYRGRLVPDAEPLSAQSIRQLGVLISDKQFGRFQLEIESVRAVVRRNPSHSSGTTDE